MQYNIQNDRKHFQLNIWHKPQELSIKKLEEFQFFFAYFFLSLLFARHCLDTCATGTRCCTRAKRKRKKNRNEAIQAKKKKTKLLPSTTRQGSSHLVNGQFEQTEVNISSLHRHLHSVEWLKTELWWLLHIGNANRSRRWIRKIKFQKQKNFHPANRCSPWILWSLHLRILTLTLIFRSAVSVNLFRFEPLECVNNKYFDRIFGFLVKSFHWKQSMNWININQYKMIRVIGNYGSKP